MYHNAGLTTSIWMNEEKKRDRPVLQKDENADVCVVGAGIAGLSIAYELSAEGKSVIVLDDGPIGGGETERTSAHLASALDDGFARLESLFGSDNAKLAYESHAAAIDRIEHIAQEEKIDCDFRRVDGYLFAETGDEEELEKELIAATHIEVDVKKLDRLPIDGFEPGPCLQFLHQGQFHPMKYVEGLARAIEKHGGKIYCGSHVTEVEGGDKAHVITSDGHTVHAASIVVATNSPFNDRVTMHTKQAAYRSYIVALAIPKGSVPIALYWDMHDPYHYIRVQEEKERDVLIVGGEDHKTGQANDAGLRYQRLEEWTRKRFLKAREVLYRWSGQVLEPYDSLAYIGHNPHDHKNVYIATGDSGHGLTHGVIAGMLIRDLILERENPWSDIYNPSRTTPRAVMDFLKEGLNVMKEYGDLLTTGDVQSEDSIAKGAGAVIRDGVCKIALYRDDEGTLHKLSAVCPHLGCIVSWNSAEKTWDCPCHGSRYLADGTVVNGPSPVNMKPHE